MESWAGGEWGKMLAICLIPPPSHCNLAFEIIIGLLLETSNPKSKFISRIWFSSNQKSMKRLLSHHTIMNDKFWLDDLMEFLLE